jgi:hypothetical protein
MVVYNDLSKDDLPEGAPMPKIGDEQKGSDGKIRKVATVLTWQDRRARSARSRNFACRSLRSCLARQDSGGSAQSPTGYASGRPSQCGSCADA